MGSTANIHNVAYLIINLILFLSNFLHSFIETSFKNISSKNEIFSADFWDYCLRFCQNVTLELFLRLYGENACAMKVRKYCPKCGWMRLREYGDDFFLRFSNIFSVHRFCGAQMFIPFSLSFCCCLFRRSVCLRWFSSPGGAPDDSGSDWGSRKKIRT